MRIKLFTHTDLDGIGCSIVAKHAFQKTGGTVDTTYCGYKTIDKKVSDFIDTGEHVKYNFVFITDISVSEEVAEKINRCSNFQLIDHHATAEWLNKYPWAMVISMEAAEGNRKGRRLTSGTSLFYEYLVTKGFLKANLDLAEFVEYVRMYDTWEWKLIYQDEHARKLNDLFNILGWTKFEERFIHNPSPKFTKEENLILELEEQKTELYLTQKAKDMKTINLNFGGREYLVGLVFAEQKQSELGNYLCQINHDLDFVMMVDLSRNAVSLRTSSDHIHLGEIAKSFGGGGHQKAAGFNLSDDFSVMILKYFQNLSLTG